MPNPVAQQVYDVFRHAGATHAQALGILANMDVESGFDPRAVGDHGTAHGLCQWHSDRVSAIRHGCGIDVRSASAADQARAIIYELQHLETDAWYAIQRATRPAAAAAAFCEKYERPANVGQQVAIRERVANQLARDFA